MLRIIISPAKKMNVIDDYFFQLTTPVFLEQTKRLHASLLKMSPEELKKLWQCSDKLASQNYERLHLFSLDKNLTPALLAYEGIQYQTMAPHIFSEKQWDYAAEHLRILSGFYGILKPTDGVIPYRLEMQAKFNPDAADYAPANAIGKQSKSFDHTLYHFWKDRLYQELTSEVSPLTIVNLASAEYSKTILPYIEAPVSQVTCIFGEWNDGKVKMKGTQAKMARGEMVRWMSENQIENVQELRHFSRLNYQFREDLSSDTEYVFVKSSSC